MSTITREWLQQAINDYESVRDELPFGLDDYQGNILAALRIALASLEAEPV
ncbi:Eaa protein, partial [Escherichia coli]|nr:Eaa protein [Escherichia coli]